MSDSPFCSLFCRNIWQFFIMRYLLLISSVLSLEVCLNYIPLCCRGIISLKLEESGLLANSLNLKIFSVNLVVLFIWLLAGGEMKTSSCRGGFVQLFIITLFNTLYITAKQEITCLKHSVLSLTRNSLSNKLYWTWVKTSKLFNSHREEHSSGFKSGLNLLCHDVGYWMLPQCQ